MTGPPSHPPEAGSRTRLPTWSLVLLALLVAVVPSFIAVILLDGGYERFPDARSLIVDFVVPQAAVALVLGAVVARKRAWGPVVRESRRVRPWVWFAPAVVTATALAVIDLGRLMDAGPAALWGAIGILLLATNEEVVFRGLFLVELRHRTTESRAAWISSLAFGLVHLLGGPIQVVVSALFGHLLYYSRRVSGGIVVPIVVHAAWNFSVLTAYLSESPAESATASVYLTLATVAVLLVLAAGRRRVEPALPQPDASPAP